MANRKKYLFIQIFVTLFCALFLVFGVYLFRSGLFHTKVVSLNYKDFDKTSYKVYLKKNDFFDQEYLEQGNTYITSLIDYIHIDYNYQLDFDKPVTGNYTYHVVATIEANKADNEIGNYWTKDFNLTSDKTVNVDNAKHLKIEDSIDVDYNKYNEMLNYFKKTVGLANSDGVLKIKLVSGGNIKSGQIDSPIKSELTLKMPLSQLSVEGSIEKDSPNTVKVISKTVEDKRKIFTIYVVLGSILIIFAFLLMILSYKIKKRYNKDNLYDNTLRKILSTYDSIIVNVKELPNMKDYNVIKVESFSEMIDAHSEVRMPINYYHNDEKSVFLLYNDKAVWMYELIKSELIKGSAK